MADFFMVTASGSRLLENRPSIQGNYPKKKGPATVFIRASVTGRLDESHQVDGETHDIKILDPT